MAGKMQASPAMMSNAFQPMGVSHEQAAMYSAAGFSLANITAWFQALGNDFNTILAQIVAFISNPTPVTPTAKELGALEGAGCPKAKATAFAKAGIPPSVLLTWLTTLIGKAGPFIAILEQILTIFGVLVPPPAPVTPPAPPVTPPVTPPAPPTP